MHTNGYFGFNEDWAWSFCDRQCLKQTWSVSNTAGEQLFSHTKLRITIKVVTKTTALLVRKPKMVSVKNAVAALRMHSLKIHSKGEKTNKIMQTLTRVCRMTCSSINGHDIETFVVGITRTRLRSGNSGESRRFRLPLLTKPKPILKTLNKANITTL